MIDDTPIDVLTAIFYSRENFPEEFKFVEFLKVMNILKNLFKIFVRFENILLIKDF